eukprot:g1752.t1
MAETIRWNNCAPKAPKKRIGPTHGALRVLRRNDAEKDGWASDDSCIPDDCVLKPRRRPELIDAKAAREMERLRLKKELEDAANFARAKRAVNRMEAAAIEHFRRKFGRDDYGTTGRKRERAMKLQLGAMGEAAGINAPVSEPATSRAPTFRQFALLDSPAAPGRTRAAKQIYNPSRGG